MWARQSADPRFDNSRNDVIAYTGDPLPGTPLDRIVLGMLQDLLKNDFIEYNSRPYQYFSWAAIQNLYDYADDTREGGRKVKLAARMVLDYLSAKVAVSSADARRNPPYRRRRSHYHSDLFHPQSDPLKDRFLIYTAPTLVMGEVAPPNSIRFGASSSMVLAAATTYQPPNLVLDLMVNPAHRSFFQRFRHAGAEVYSAEPDFLISAGGIPTGHPYANGVEVVFVGDDDYGSAVPTTLMPTGQFTTVERMIKVFDPSLVDNVGLCVAPGFACGFFPAPPPWYTSADRVGCWVHSGDFPAWTYIDRLSPGCANPSHPEFGFYVAIYRGDDEFGFFEAVPKAKLAGVPFQEFINIHTNRNATRRYDHHSDNVYTAWAGNEIRFDVRRPNPIVSTGIPAIDTRNSELNDWPLAQGDILNSDGHSGKITIANPFTNEQLTLDFRDLDHPSRIER